MKADAACAKHGVQNAAKGWRVSTYAPVHDAGRVWSHFHFTSEGSVQLARRQRRRRQRDRPPELEQQRRRRQQRRGSTHLNVGGQQRGQLEVVPHAVAEDG